MKTRWILPAMLALVPLVACGDDSKGGIGSTSVPSIELSEGGLSISSDSVITVNVGAVPEGQLSKVSEIRLINTGQADLKIDAFDIVSTPPGAFELRNQDGSTLPGTAGGPQLVVNPQDGDGAVRNVFINLMYLRTPENSNATATVTVKSNSVSGDIAQGTIAFAIELGNTNARLQVVPTQVDFGNVGQGQDEFKTLALLNQGSEELVIDEFILSGHPAFAYTPNGTRYPVTPESSSVGITLDPPLIVKAGESVNTQVFFAPTGPEPAEGNLVLFSNDPNAKSGTVVPLQGNVGGPCIAVNPKKVDFGGKLIGKPARVSVEVTSCGDQPLEINEVALTAESNTDFSLALETLPGVSSATPVTQLGPADPPVVLQPNQTAEFEVVYIPDSLNPLDSDGQPIPDLGSITVVSNAFISQLDVEVRGFGVEVECPTARIIVQEGEEVIPQTKLHLIGSQSFAATGAIEEYRWEVQQPVGSQQIFIPSAVVADPTFQPNIAGTYVFRLTVKDSSGEESCVQAEAIVVVNPDEAIHVELVWDTPNDPDQTDEGPVAGADLDLHFVHPFGTGGYDGDNDGQLDGYFDEVFDAFWFHSEPNWASIDPNIDDNPSLDRDDTDGAGPENVNLNGPENGLAYKIGVHYWSDHGFGPSTATVRVFIYANLVFENQADLINQDMWTVGFVNWPQGNVTPSKVCQGVTPPQVCSDNSECTAGSGECGKRIYGPYRHPFFPNE